MSLLELHDVRKNFGAIEALRGVMFSVEAGSVVGLVGDNGAGKSTLMKTITGIHRPDSGEIRFDGASLAGRDPGDIRKAGIEMIYQDLALARMRDVASNIFLGRELTHNVLGLKLIDAKRMRAEAEAMIAKLGARVKSVDPDRRPAFRRTAAVGGDRPRPHLQPQARHHGRADGGAGGARDRARARTHPHARLAGIAVILISHRLTDVFAVCDRIVVLRQGAVIADDPTAATTMNAVVAHIVGATDAAPSRSGEMIRRRRARPGSARPAEHGGSR